jgi:hypothetical protein
MKSSHLKLVEHIGVDMGRNIFQSDAPKAMIAAVGAVVHKSMKPRQWICSIR